MATNKKPYDGEAPDCNDEARERQEVITHPAIPGKIESYELSKREMDILNRLLMGDSYKMIANACSINIGTVNSHINSLYKKLHVHSKSEAVIKAIRENLV